MSEEVLIVDDPMPPVRRLTLNRPENTFEVPLSTQSEREVKRAGDKASDRNGRPPVSGASELL